jgi:hypothetical protein
MNTSHEYVGAGRLNGGPSGAYATWEGSEPTTRSVVDPPGETRSLSVARIIQRIDPLSTRKPRFTPDARRAEVARRHRTRQCEAIADLAGHVRRGRLRSGLAATPPGARRQRRQQPALLIPWQRVWVARC